MVKGNDHRSDFPYLSNLNEGQLAFRGISLGVVGCNTVAPATSQSSGPNTFRLRLTLTIRTRTE